MKNLAIAIDALLPQTQCGLCGHGGCMPYAVAIAEKQEAINRCPPGGMVTQEALSQLTGLPVQPLLDESVSLRPKQVARVLEDLCIGCTLCIKACPVDAIVGTNKRMHTVLTDECTGCGLCLPPCPMDCIVLEPHPTQVQTWALGDQTAKQRADHARKRYEARQARLAPPKEHAVTALDLKALLTQALQK